MYLRYSLVFAGAALALGVAASGLSGLPISDPARLGQALLYGAFLFIAMAVFLLVLPKRFGVPVQILIAMILGVLAGWIMSYAGLHRFIDDYLNIFGTLFILLLKLVIVPLIFVSIVCGVSGLGDVRRLGGLGAKTILYYFGTTAIAVFIGLACVNIIQPGRGQEALRPGAVNTEPADEVLTADPEPKASAGRSIQDKVLPAIVRNPIMADQDPLVIIFFAILLGAALSAVGTPAEPVIKVFKGLDKAFIVLVMWIMFLAPLGVFALMAKAIATLGIEYILTLGKYCITVILALGLHFVMLTCVIVMFVARISPLRFIRGMAPAFQLAFSTSSSTATLPVTIECATERLGADENISNFVLPIGATINMDGTALYQSVAALFIAQVYGLDLTLTQQFSVFITAILVSIGAAGIPGASVGLMGIVLASAGIPLEGIGIVIGVDRFLDMCRTLVNVTGDSAGAIVLSRFEGSIRSE